MSFDVSSEHIPAHIEQNEEFFFHVLLWILRGPCHLMGFLCLWSSILEHEIQNGAELFGFNVILQVFPSISSFLLCSSYLSSHLLSPIFPHLPVLPSIHPSITNILVKEECEGLNNVSQQWNATNPTPNTKCQPQNLWKQLSPYGHFWTQISAEAPGGPANIHARASG